MSEISPNIPASEQSLMFRVRHYAAAGVAVLAGVVPVHRIEQDTWTEQVPFTETVPESTHTVGYPISETVIHDSAGEEVDVEDLSKLFLFDVNGEAEREEFIEAVKAVVDPEQDVLVTRDGADVIIRTGDFARVENAGDPTDKQSSTLRVAVDGRLIHATGMNIDTVTTPDHEVVKTRDEEHNTTEEILYYQQAVVPEKPQVKRKDPPTRESLPIKIRKQPAPEETVTEPVAVDQPEDPEILPPTGPRPPEAPGTETETIVTPPLSPESPDTVIPERAGVGGRGGLYGRHQRPTERRLRQILDEIADEDAIAFSRPPRRGIRLPEVTLPRLDGRIPRVIIAGLLLSGAAAGWYYSEFESVEDCELGTPEQPLNIVKERGEWLPEVSRPDCPEPEGHVLRITFDGFERGYAKASLSETGEISNIAAIPQELMPESVVDSVVGGRFVGRVNGLLSSTDEARAVVAEQSASEHNPIVFGE